MLKLIWNVREKFSQVHAGEKIGFSKPIFVSLVNLRKGFHSHFISVFSQPKGKILRTKYYLNIRDKNSNLKSCEFNRTVTSKNELTTNHQKTNSSENIFNVEEIDWELVQRRKLRTDSAASKLNKRRLAIFGGCKA